MLIIIFRRILSNSPWRRLRKGVFLEGPTAAALSIPTSQVWSLVGRPTKSCSPEIHRNCDTATVLCLTLEVIGLGHRESSQAWLKHVEMHRNIETKKIKPPRGQRKSGWYTYITWTVAMWIFVCEPRARAPCRLTHTMCSYQVWSLSY